MSQVIVQLLSEDFLVFYVSNIKKGTLSLENVMKFVFLESLYCLTKEI